MKKVLVALGLVVFYVFYVPCVIVKDITEMLYGLVDSNRICNAYVSLMKNLTTITDVIFNPEKTDEPEEEKEESKKIGFQCMAPAKSLENQTNPESPKD